jgi:hypothetical protein
MVEERLSILEQSRTLDEVGIATFWMEQIVGWSR